ncbi:membrane protein insertase YidC [Virgibacillus sp.]|uniref:membrane protein insertase YidC n=1 Tax=Virgibacillus sp. TaxID=1872700 RepID=UPI00184E90C5|nr:membrane protein insertase YidC [Virgibacillus sp.]NWO12724.1 membrane protein insertase YidC [Virgibacillus sp.]
MHNHFIFTFFKKYGVISLGLLFLLTGCQADGGMMGFQNPFPHMIKYVASLFGNDYGLSIVLITILIRLLLMPLAFSQMKKGAKMKTKMKEMKPEMDALSQKYKNKKDASAKAAMQKEMMQLYQKHEFNPISSMGCLPIMLQFPVVIAFYHAIRNSQEIATHSFLWFNLGEVDIILPFIAAAVYFLQSRFSLIGMDEKQKKQMAIMGLISPIMIGFISFSTAAALPLYWTVSGTVLVIQTLVAKKLYYREHLSNKGNAMEKLETTSS